MSELILGPQIPLGGDSWFDRTEVSVGKRLGESCPVTPPTDPAALNDYNLHLQYYDLPLCLYIIHARTGDPYFLDLARKALDSWWQHPEWIGSGKIRLWETQGSATPAPRHAGIGGLILRALDGRPELWDWIVGYTRWNFDIWLKSRIDNFTLHIGVREGAFMLQYAAWLAVTLPDTYPLQAGGMAVNGAQIRAQFLADVESVAVNYFGRLQKSDGSWRWDDFDVTDADGTHLVGITQPFMIGLLLSALCDVHQIVFSGATKTIIARQILSGCRHLYADGPYRKDEVIPYDPTKRRRSFWYLYHGGTVLNPTKFEKGGWSYPGNNITEIKDERQSIGPVVAAFGYAYLISGDEFYKQAGDELWNSAYGDTDGIRNFMDTDGKGFNQNVRRAGSYPAWAAGGAFAPQPIPTPLPPQPTPAPTPPSIPDPVIAITAPANGTSVSGKITVTISVSDATGISELYLIVDGITDGGGDVAQGFTLDTTKLSFGAHLIFVRAWKDGKPIDSKDVSVVVANVAPQPAPAPQPVPCSMDAPASITVPRNSTGQISVTLADVTKPTSINVIGSDGQVTVSPLSKTVNSPGAIVAFQVKVKKQSRQITFQSSCGSKDVMVNVQ